MISISKNVYIDKLDDIVNKYNNTYHSTIKNKPVDVKSDTYIGSNKKLIIMILNLKFMMQLEYQNKKTFLQKVSTFIWTYIINDLKREETVGTFYKKGLQKANYLHLSI